MVPKFGWHASIFFDVTRMMVPPRRGLFGEGVVGEEGICERFQRPGRVELFGLGGFGVRAILGVWHLVGVIVRSGNGTGRLSVRRSCDGGRCGIAEGVGGVPGAGAV